MSVERTESETAREECEERASLPETTPLFPVVAFASEAGVDRGANPLRVYAESTPTFFDDDDELYDARGRLLERVTGEDGTQRLEARGEGHPAEVQRRFMEVLRSFVARAHVAPGDEAAVEATVAWLDAAPDLATLVLGSGVGNDAVLASLNCISGCSPWTKIWNKACCK